MLPNQWGKVVSFRSDLIGFAHPLVWHYLLIEGDEVVALDTGMAWSKGWIERWFRKTGRPPQQLRAILLTHGHLDHAGCAESLRRWSGAEVFLHPADISITRGRFPYRGWSRVAGMLEAMGRSVSGYLPPKIGGHLYDGQLLPFWGGLQVVHLPGHTPGHVGFYSASKRILFIGDAILAPFGKAAFPLPIFNTDNKQARTCVSRVVDLDVEWVYPMHHDRLRHNLMDSLRRYALRMRQKELGASTTGSA